MSIMSTYRLTLSQSSCDIEAPLTRYARQREYIKKSELHYRNGQHNTELDLLVVRQQQLRRVEDWRTANVGGRLCHHTAQTGRL